MENNYRLLDDDSILNNDDSDVNIAYTKENYESFQRSYNLYIYGQKLYESCCQFAFLSGSNLIEGSL